MPSCRGLSSVPALKPVSPGKGTLGQVHPTGSRRTGGHTSVPTRQVWSGLLLGDRTAAGHSDMEGCVPSRSDVLKKHRGAHSRPMVTASKQTNIESGGSVRAAGPQVSCMCGMGTPASCPPTRNLSSEDVSTWRFIGEEGTLVPPLGWQALYGSGGEHSMARGPCS